MRHRTDWLGRVLPVAIAAYVGVVSVWAWGKKCPTWDEPSHVTAGYVYWKLRDFDMYAVNPPLGKEIIAVPLLVLKPRLPDPDSAWWAEKKVALLSQEFLYGGHNDPDRLFRWIRIWMACWGGLLLLVLYGWLARTASPALGLLAVSLLATNPSFLALLPLATTDTLFVLATVLLAWACTSFVRKPGLTSAGYLGLSWGSALATKHTALVFAPIVVMILAVPAIRAGEKTTIRGSIRRTAVQAIIVIVAAFLVIWASYGFATAPTVQSPDDLVKLKVLVQKFVPGPVEGLEQGIVRRVEEARIPARPYVVSSLDMLGLRPTLTAADSGFTRLKYLCGRRHREGFRSFTLFALVAKNPLPFLLAVVIGLFFGRTLPTPVRLVCLSFLAVLFGVGTLKRDFAFRYFNFPMLPFLAVVGANGLLELARRWPKTRILVPAILVWGLAECWASFPHLLPYFSPILGGSERGVACLLDSNSDWGQDLPLLAEWQKKTGAGVVKLAYNGTVPPAHYGLRFVPLPGVDASTFEERPDPQALEEIARRTRPDTGLYAISTTCLYNIQGFYPGADYTWLLQHKPVAVLGHTIRVYRVRGEAGQGEGSTRAPTSSPGCCPQRSTR